ncbi:hypothetical protein SeMB42_g07709 [Synchytrium endobioticum]|uniref:BTB domain-containing protein n=1 Tax=Synchytrium endobioticum TaxID=286115 RepID=A0A507C2L5_9FUNG|nr:hypothetical protein SeMB42_g07709 [Synchytrium endobioticum]
MLLQEVKEFMFLPQDRNSTTREATAVWGWTFEEQHSLMSQIQPVSVLGSLYDGPTSTIMSISIVKGSPYFSCRVTTASYTPLTVELTSLRGDVVGPKGTFAKAGPDEWHTHLQFDENILQAATQLPTNGWYGPTVLFHYKLTFARVEPQRGRTLFSRYLYDRKFSDAFLVAKVSDRASIDIPVSKLVLAGTSEVFYKMFSAGFAESESHAPRIDMGGVSEVALRAMVEFIYTNTIITVLDNMELRKELFDLSERYEIEKLANIAADMIIERDLTLATVLELLEYSEKYSNKVLYNACVEYSKDNRNALVKHLLMAALEGVELRKELNDLSERYGIDKLANLAANIIAEKDLTLGTVVNILNDILTRHYKMLV